MQKMESNNLAAVLDIQKEYEKKLDIQDSNYLTLEQSKLEMKQHFEK